MALKKRDLIDFEREIADLFNAKKIPAVIHLYSGGEDELIEIFKNIRPQDWVLGSWRSHYECLLKGVPREELKAAILAGNSIHLCFPKQRILCSGIVGGTAPIAVGLALAAHRRKEDTHVHCFIGDMTSETGIVHECMKYSENFMLPLTFWIADNGRSATTDTKKVWGLKKLTHQPSFAYEMGRYAHAGTDKWVNF